MKINLVSIKDNVAAKLPLKKVPVPGFIKKLNIKNNLVKLLPYGRNIEKVYLLIILITFLILLFKSGTNLTEDKILIITISTGGLFILRSLRKKIYFPKTYSILITAFFAVCLLSTIFSINPYNSILRLAEVTSALVVSILSYDIIYGKYSRRWILNSVTIILSLVLIYSIVKYIIDKNSLLTPLGLPIYMGGIIVLILPFSISSILKTRGIKQSLFLVTTFIMLLASALTFSRAVYVLVILELLVSAIVNTFMGRKVLLKRKFYIPILAVVLLTIFSAILLHFKTSSTVPFSAISLADRNLTFNIHKDLYQQALDTFRSFPILGTGLGNYKIASLYHLHNAWEMSYYMYNDILEQFVTVGIVGGLLFLGIVAYVLYEIFVNFKKIFVKQAPETFELSIGIIAVLLLALYVPILNVPAILYMLFVFIGILLKALNVDNIKRYYLGNLSIGLVNGLSLFFIIISIYFFFTSLQFTSIRNNVGIVSVAETQKQIENLVKINPLNSEYSATLAQVYMSQNMNDKALGMISNALRYDSESTYLRYIKSLAEYFKGDYSKSSKDYQSLVNDAPYADPSYYLLGLQLDQNANNQDKFKIDLMHVAKVFPINSTFYLYQTLFAQLGFSDALSKVYIELAVLTKDQSYFTTAQKINPTGLSF